MAREQVQALDLPIVNDDPGALLLEEVRRSASVVRYVHERVVMLGDQLIDERGQPDPWVTLWERQRRQLTDAASRAVAVGVARRHVELAEAQGELAGQLVVRVLHQMGLNYDLPTVRGIMRQQFNLISNVEEARWPGA